MGKMELSYHEGGRNAAEFIYTQKTAGRSANTNQREGGMKAASEPMQEYLQQSRQLEKVSSTKALLLC